MMTHTDAVAVVSGVWSGSIREDARLPLALATLGMSVTSFRNLTREAIRVTRRRNRFEIPTPTGGWGRRN